MQNSRTPLLHLTVFVITWLLPGGVLAYDYGSSVNVCNKGDIDLHYVAFATNNSFFSGYKAKISAWHTVEPNDCEDVGISGYETVALGFLQINDMDVRGNPVYILEDATSVGSTEWAPATLCVPVNDRLSDSGTHGAISNRYKPPCQQGFAEFRM